MTDNNASVVLEGLDPVQREAVRAVDGPVLIVAGAGSGKTRVLTSRIAWLLQGGCPPDRILALTFTRKAAREMKERIAAMVGERRARRLYMGTFHSVFVRFLREFAPLLGYPAAFTIYDTSDSVSAVKTCIRELGLDEKAYKPKDVLARISKAKNYLLTAEKYRTNAQLVVEDTHSRRPELHRIYARYEEKCRQSGVMDFDDILLNMNILLRDFPDARASVAGRFDYLLVDEYQDTNYAQYLILKVLAAPHGNICVVGDDAQSIYAFRGARIENILSFRKDYPKCRIFALERNYRSTRTIVEAANSLIARNESRIPKDCFSTGEEGDRIRLIQAFTEQEEALLIAASIIGRMQADGARYSDFAILYRTNSQSRALEEALRKRNLPYMIYSGNSFFERAEVKDMMAYFKLAVNPADDESFRRIVNKPARGIGDTSITALQAAAREAGVPLLQAVFLENLETFGLRPAGIARLRGFASLVQQASERIGKENADSVAVSLADSSGLYAFYKADMSIEGQSRTANVEELLSSVKVFVEDRQNEMREQLLAEGTAADVTAIRDEDLPPVTLGDYLEDVSLLSAVDVEEGEDAANRIALMTVHSAKGLEFPYVYVAGMEENLFPSAANLLSQSDLEEERRLLYVALTRAKKAVSLTFAETRMRNGKHESNAPSRFIREIDSRYIANPLRPESRLSWDDDGDEPSRFPGFGRRFSSGEGYRGGRIASANVAGNGRPRPGVSFSGTSRPDRPAGGGSGFPPVRPAPPPVQADAGFVPLPVRDLQEGMRIEHNRFGPGKILQITGEGTDLKARIAFDAYGEKILLLKYAKMRREGDGSR